MMNCSDVLVCAHLVVCPLAIRTSLNYELQNYPFSVRIISASLQRRIFSWCPIFVKHNVTPISGCNQGTPLRKSYCVTTSSTLHIIADISQMNSANYALHCQLRKATDIAYCSTKQLDMRHVAILRDELVSGNRPKLSSCRASDSAEKFKGL